MPTMSLAIYRGVVVLFAAVSVACGSSSSADKADAVAPDASPPPDSSPDAMLVAPPLWNPVDLPDMELATPRRSSYSARQRSAARPIAISATA